MITGVAAVSRLDITSQTHTLINEPFRRSLRREACCRPVQSEDDGNGTHCTSVAKLFEPSHLFCGTVRLPGVVLF